MIHFYLWLIVSIVIALLSGIAVYASMHCKSQLLDNEKNDDDETAHGSSVSRAILLTCLAVFVVIFLVLMLAVSILERNVF